MVQKYEYPQQTEAVVWSGCSLTLLWRETFCRNQHISIFFFLLWNSFLDSCGWCFSGSFWCHFPEIIWAVTVDVTTTVSGWTEVEVAVIFCFARTAHKEITVETNLWKYVEFIDLSKSGGKLSQSCAFCDFPFLEEKMKTEAAQLQTWLRLWQTH